MKIAEDKVFKFTGSFTPIEGPTHKIVELCSSKDGITTKRIPLSEEEKSNFMKWLFGEEDEKK